VPDLGLSTVRKGSTSEMWFVPPPPVRRQNRQARRVRRRGRPLVRPLAVILLIASFWLALAVTAKVDPTPQLAAENWPRRAGRSLPRTR